MGYCRNCGTRILDGYEFCPNCGMCIPNNTIKQNSNTKKEKYKCCKYCGEWMPEDAFYCLGCGRTFDNYENGFEEIKRRVLYTSEPKRRFIDTSVGVWKNKWVSLILCIFFGVFGIHRFYEEKKTTGYIYLFTFGVLGMGWFFDIILLATKTNPYRVR